jgi:peptide/nickel transport system substrate-binding protein
MKSSLLHAVAALGLTALLASCGGGGSSGGTTTVSDTPLVYATEDLNGKFSPFTGESAYDIAVSDMVVGDGLVMADRVGVLVYKGIDGETRSYNGNNYTYDGIANVTETYNAAADTTTYNFKLRTGVKFSDGQVMDADDVIFSLYVFCDPSYAGNTTLGSLPIQGLKAYRTKTTDEVYERYSAIANAILAAGPDKPGAGSGYTADQYNSFFGLYTRSWKDYAQKIINYCVNNYGADAAAISGLPLATTPGLQVALGMMDWGFGRPNDDGSFTSAVLGKSWDMVSNFPTVDDYYHEFVAAYGTLEAFAGVELIDSDADDPVGDAVNAFISEYGTKDASMAGVVIDSITGIRKVNQNEVEIVIDGVSSAAIYRFSFQPAPLHYYGSEALYDYNAHKFGFPFGDISSITAKDSAPMGAGPYKFVKYENRVVYFEANENYWRGVPKTKFVQFKITAEADKVTAVTTGTADISEPSISKERALEISGANSNKQFVGDVLTPDLVDFLGYGYIGINASRIAINNVPGSEASKNLRKGLATVLAVYRDLTVDSYYGETASVINYPISSTSWAAPQRTDPGYRVAYSLDVNGNEIYTASMNAEARYAAASKAALGFFEAAGFTLNAGKTAVTAPPAGGSLSYVVMIGQAETHPSFLLLTSAREALGNIGITLDIQDVDWSVLSSAMSAGTNTIWVAAWGATLDPDLYQTHHSSNVIGKGQSSNMYMIADPALDALIDENRNSTDKVYRREVLRSAYDIIMDWGVEIPVYQRSDCNLFSTKRINTATLPKDMTTYYGWAREVHKIALN